MANDTTRGNGGIKAVGAIVLILAVIAGVYAMIEPMSQRIDFLERQLQQSGEQIQVHAASKSHIGIAGDIATMRETFKEVETQFDDMDRRLTRYEGWHDWWVRTVPTLDATQNARLNALERAVYQGKEIN